MAWTCDEYVDRTSLCQCTALNTWPQWFKSWITLSTGRIEIYSVDSVIHLPKNYIADKSEKLDNEAQDGRKGENRGGPLGAWDQAIGCAIDRVGWSEALCATECEEESSGEVLFTSPFYHVTRPFLPS